MIEIDLLPKQLRANRPAFLRNPLKTSQLYTILAVVVCLQLFLQAFAMLGARRLKKLEGSWRGLTSEQTEIEQLKNQFSALNVKIPIITQLVNNRVLWSKILNDISDLMVPGVWLSEISLEQHTVELGRTAFFLVIKGKAASQAKDEPALIGNFMQCLKRDPGFSSSFSEIEMGAIRKGNIAQTEIMDFILTCRFKDEKTQALME